MSADYICQILWSLVYVLKNGTFVKDGALAWYSVKICVNFGVRFERRKVDKKANLRENWNMQTLCVMSSKSILMISSYTVSKLARFWDTVYFHLSSLIRVAGYRRCPDTVRVPTFCRRRPWKSSVSVGNSTCDVTTAVRCRRFPGTTHHPDHRSRHVPRCNMWSI